MDTEAVLAKGLIERIGMEGSVLKHTPEGKYTVDINIDVPNHSFGIKLAVDALTNPDYGVIKSMNEIDAVGHRVVHGGERFADSVLVTPDCRFRPCDAGRAERHCRLCGACAAAQPAQLKRH